MGTQLIRWDGMISMVTGGLLLVWWIPVSALLPRLNANIDLLEIVDDWLWLPFNVPGMVAAILLPGVLVTLYIAQKGMVSKVGQVGFYLSLLGSVMFAWVQMEQTLVWPKLVEEAPHLVDLNGPMFRDIPFAVVYWSAHGLLGIGLLLFGRTTAKAGVFPKWAGHLLWFGGLIFGFSGPLPWLRFLAVLALGPALTWMGYLQWRDRGAAY
jgi:hypothetical protein